MIVLLVFVAFVFLLLADNTGSGSGRRKQTGRRGSGIEKAEALYRLQEAQRKREAQERKEAEARKRQYIKDLQQQQKEAEKEEKQRQKIERAEKDLLFINEQLKIANDILQETERQLETINEKIKVDINGQYYDSEKADLKRREAILKKLIAAKNRVHALETKAEKTLYILGI